MYTLPPTSLKIGAEIIRRSLKTPKISHNIEKYGNTVDQLPYVSFFLNDELIKCSVSYGYDERA